jgi:hypothetical protein
VLGRIAAHASTDPAHIAEAWEHGAEIAPLRRRAAQLAGVGVLGAGLIAHTVMDGRTGPYYKR